MSSFFSSNGKLRKKINALRFFHIQNKQTQILSRAINHSTFGIGTYQTSDVSFNMSGMCFVFCSLASHEITNTYFSLFNVQIYCCITFPEEMGDIPQKMLDVFKQASSEEKQFSR